MRMIKFQCETVQSYLKLNIFFCVLQNSDSFIVGGLAQVNPRNTETKRKIFFCIKVLLIYNLFYLRRFLHGTQSLISRVGCMLRYLQCCKFRPAFGCSARQTLVEIVIYNVFAAKKSKKSKKFAANFCKFLQKNRVF